MATTDWTMDDLNELLIKFIERHGDKYIEMTLEEFLKLHVRRSNSTGVGDWNRQDTFIYQMLKHWVLNNIKAGITFQQTHRWS